MPDAENAGLDASVLHRGGEKHGDAPELSTRTSTTRRTLDAEPRAKPRQKDNRGAGDPHARNHDRPYARGTRRYRTRMRRRGEPQRNRRQRSLATGDKLEPLPRLRRRDERRHAKQAPKIDE